MKISYLLLASLSILFLASCGEAIENIKLDHYLQKKYRCEEVVSTIYNNRDKIRIRLINCDCNNAGSDEQQSIADSVGKLLPQFFNKPRFNEGQLDFEKRHNFLIGSSSTSVGYDLHIKKEQE